MEAGKKIGQAEIWVGIHGSRQAGKAEHDLVEMLVVAVAAVLAGTDTFVEIEARATEKLDWLQHCGLNTAPPRTTPSAGSSRRSAQTSLRQPFAAGSAKCYLRRARTRLPPPTARPAASPARWGARPRLWSALLRRARVYSN